MQPHNPLRQTPLSSRRTGCLPHANATRAPHSCVCWCCAPSPPVHSPQAANAHGCAQGSPSGPGVRCRRAARLAALRGRAFCRNDAGGVNIFALGNHCSNPRKHRAHTVQANASGNCASALSLSLALPLSPSLPHSLPCSLSLSLSPPPFLSLSPYSFLSLSLSYAGWLVYYLHESPSDTTQSNTCLNLG